MRIYYGRQDVAGRPRVLVWDNGKLWFLAADMHPRCPEEGHGWSEEVQGLNTAFTILRDALPGKWGEIAVILAQRFRAGTVAKLPAKEWQFSREDVLRWVLEEALTEAWPALHVRPSEGEEVDFEPLR